jgi:hypothetical protein
LDKQTSQSFLSHILEISEYDVDTILPTISEVSMLHTDEMKSLEYAIAEIMEIADGFGLDYFPMRYEICPAE